MSRRYSSFRRTLVGLKPEVAFPDAGDRRRRPRFRRTLVGLKQVYFLALMGLFVLFQTDPRGVEAARAEAAPRRIRVSDGPSWG